MHGESDVPDPVMPAAQASQTVFAVGVHAVSTTGVDPEQVEQLVQVVAPEVEA